MIMTRVLAFILLTTAPVAGQNVGDAALGKTIFLRDNCYTCHGTSGGGGGALGGPRLSHRELTPTAILNELRHPRAAMPAYSDKVLSDAEAADIAAYLQSLSRVPDKDAKDIPLLNQ
jgi:ubiquinol-cytochrome c reductase cytochrome c subunit